MIPTFKSVLMCENKKPRLVWILLFLLLNEVRWIKTEFNVTILEDTCDDKYNADYYESFRVQFNGSDLLYENPCSVEFYKDSNDHYLCVSGEEINLDCNTELEYHTTFVKNNIDPDPEKEMLCNSTFLDEWCSGQNIDRIYVVIRKPVLSTSDVIRLKVYLKVPDDDENDGFVTILLVAVFIVVLVIIFSIVGMCIRFRMAQKYSKRPATYQTASGTVNIQGGSPYPTTQPPVGQQQFGIPQGNYDVHPTQAAYPVQGNSTASSTFEQRYPPVAPSNTAAPPPQYAVGGTNF